MMNTGFGTDVFQEIRSDFSSLWRSRILGNTLVVDTPYSMISGEVISVYITQRGSRYIVTDGARIDKLAREQEVNVFERKGCHLRDVLSRFAIDEHRVDSPDGFTYRYKSTEDVSMLSSIVYDMLHFIDSISNKIMLESYFRPEVDKVEEVFRRKVNAVLKYKIDQLPKKERRYEWFKNKSARALQFSSSLIDEKIDSLWLGMCINGSNFTNYMRSVQRAEFGFNHARDTELGLHRNLSFASITDEMRFGASDRFGEIQSVIGKWGSQYRVRQLSLEQLKDMPVSQLWDAVA